MNILIACEYSGVVRDAFNKKGHWVVSCDIMPSESPGWHYQGDVMDILNDAWDMIIAFPPCTHLAVSGAAYWSEKQKDGRQQKGIDFFMQFANHSCSKIVIENPVGIMSTYYRKPDQIINPFNFGVPERKRTCLWLKGLPKLIYTDNIAPPNPSHTILRKSGDKKGQPYNYYWRQGKSAKERSKTFQGIADAMAEQWGLRCLN